MLVTVPYVGTPAVPVSDWRMSRRSRPAGTAPLVVYVGSATAGNDAAVSWLVREVLPRLRAARSDVELTLVGARLTAFDVPGVRSLGFVPSLSEVLSSADVLLAPQLVASGVPVQMIEPRAAPSRLSLALTVPMPCPVSNSHQSPT